METILKKKQHPVKKVSSITNGIVGSISILAKMLRMEKEPKLNSRIGRQQI